MRSTSPLTCPHPALICAGSIIAAGLITVSPFAATTAHAQTTTYISSASFLAALQTGSYTEAFTGPFGPVTSSDYSDGTYGYTVSTPSPTGLYRSGSTIGNNLPNESLLFTFTTGNITAVGGNFFITDISDTFRRVSVTLTLNDGTTTTYTPTSAGTGSFRGFTSTTAITSLTLSAPGASRYNVVDNVTVGAAMSATPSAAPEPGSLALLLPIIGTVGMMIRKRRKN
jgi:hypothetical protein